MKWFRKAVEKGDVDAQYNLGKCYLKGEGIAKNEKEGLKYLTKAAEQNHREAKWLLQKTRNQSIGLDYSFEPFSEELVKRAEAGDVKAQLSLGMCYDWGLLVVKDDAQSFKWFKKAADQGDPSSQKNIGYCYMKGKGVAKDDPQAFEWFKKAAIQGNPTAQAMIGAYYLDGEVTAKNEKEGISWLKKAADQNDPTGLKILAKCYITGTGLPKNEKEAEKLYIKLNQCESAIQLEEVSK